MLYILWADDATLNVEGHVPDWVYTLSSLISSYDGILAVVTPAPRDVFHEIEDTLSELGLFCTLSVYDADPDRPYEAIRTAIGRSGSYFPVLRVAGIAAPQSILDKLQGYDIISMNIKKIATSEFASKVRIEETVSRRERDGMRGYWKIQVGKSSRRKNEFDPIALG